VLTSIPGSIVDFVIYQESCLQLASEELAEESSGQAAQLKLVRLLKPLRLLKMSKVLKIMNLGGVMRFVETSMGIPHETFRMLKTLVRALRSPYTRHPTFYTLHPAPCILHSATCFRMLHTLASTRPDVRVLPVALPSNFAVSDDFSICSSSSSPRS
jgi:hypothetical protein